jgi:hypothetical protein
MPVHYPLVAVQQRPPLQGVAGPIVGGVDARRLPVKWCAPYRVGDRAHDRQPVGVIVAVTADLHRLLTDVDMPTGLWPYREPVCILVL